MLKKLNLRPKLYKTYFKMVIKKNWLSLKIGVPSLKTGLCGFRFKEGCKLQFHQFNAMARIFVYYCKERSKLRFWNRNFCVPLTKKAVGVRMGKGKGKHRHWCVQFLKASTFFEAELRPDFLTRTALKLVRLKSPARVSVLKRLAWLDRFTSY